ncbi:MAG: MBL fold metallo-hydrolase [Desulfobacula sp.]|jgi:ribonuclease Z|nr:MBL fold metallo-hydrolase [Desulfobacula sp.]
MSLSKSQTKAKLFLIGCGTPTPTPERFGSCFILQVNDEYLMFDCGPASTYKMKCAGLAPTDISHLFFTHHHYDHNIDYPCFLLCRWDHEKNGIPRLQVYGPPPTELITHRLIGPEGAFVDDWKVRVEHPASQEVYAARGGIVPRPKPQFDVKDISYGSSITTKNCRVTVGKAIHLQPMMDCLAYRVEWDKGSVVFTGDTGRHELVEKLARDATTLVVNVWDHQENMASILRSGFCGTLDAAEMANKAGVQRLVITHQGPNLSLPGSKEKAIADIAAVYKGEIIFGEEFLTLDLA